MTNLPLVSVIIPNYNYAKYLSRAISSVENQTYQNIEIIVVNNGSTDESLLVLKDYGARIRVIDQENLGQAGARNSGLRAASGELIAFLDADDFWQEDKVEKQVKLIDSEYELVYSGISRFNDATCQTDSVILPKFKGDCHRFFVELPAVSIVLSGESTVLFTRNLLTKVGDFNTNLNSASGWDFFRRCAKHTKFDYISEGLTNYRLHENNMSKSVINNIEDIRKAYKVLFLDPLWSLTKQEKRRVTNRLEYSFAKTFLKEKLFVLAFQSIKRIISTKE
jgi:glycosyltransferase involved in cell wall biosynthesis